MFHAKFFFLCVVIFIGKTTSVSVLQKCDMDNGECKKALYRGIVQSAAGGVPEHKIPSVDPMALNDITASLPEKVQFTLVDAVTTGLKDCEFDHITSNINHQHTTLNITCDINIMGKYKVAVPGDVLSKLGGSGEGGEFSGDGNLKIDKLHINFDFPFTVVKKDGEIYLQIRYDGFGLSFRVNDKTTFSSDDLGLGDKTLNDNLVGFLNEHSKEIEETVAAVVANKTNEFYHAFCDWFFNSVPAKSFISDNLVSYLKN